MALRAANDDEVEADFIINGETLVIEATEVIEPECIATAHNSMQEYYPHCKIIVTHTPLLNMLCLGAELDYLESEMNKIGLSSHKKRTDRISKTFG